MGRWRTASLRDRGRWTIVDPDRACLRRLPKNLTVNYRRPDGSDAFIYFDHNYNTSLALLHEDFERDSREWTGIGNEGRKVELRVLSPLDLAVSKIDRYSPRDREDIRALASARLFTVPELQARARAAIANFIGDKRTLQTSIELICQEIRADQSDPAG